MAKENDSLVLAYFDGEQQAVAAAEQLKGWDKANEDIKLGAIGVLTLDDDGKVKTRKYGPRNTGRGAKIGVVVGVVTAILPPVGLVAGAATGAVAGGVIGSFSKKGLGMSDEDLNQLSTELQGGRAALAVLCPPAEVEATSAEMTRLGGRTRSFEVSDTDLQTAHQAITTAAEPKADAGDAMPAQDTTTATQEATKA
jgi:uncharacterized membrane protein